jgi:GNAT superfamily N-acetyltransferase
MVRGRATPAPSRCPADFDQNHGTRFREPSAYIINGHNRHLQYDTEVEIRRATAGDAEAVYEIVLRALRETNARDYPASVIDRLVLTIPEAVASKLEEWHAYVAVVDGQTVGTGSLSGITVRAVFVHPDYQGRGIGTKLMDAVENAANAQSESILAVQSSITAQPFYAKRGFKVVREAFYGEERTIVMSKDISNASE